MSKTFVTSDTHFGHAKLIEYSKLPFSSVEEMDETLIKNWNELVGRSDHVWHLGDFAFKNHLSYLERLNGRIHLVLGNHDKFSVLVKDSFEEVRDLFHGRLSGDKKSPTFFLFHYPTVSWPKKAYGCIHLYGHVHGRYKRPGERSLDVGVHSHNYKPLSITDAIALAELNYIEKGPTVES